jgi:hypothetical protein
LLYFGKPSGLFFLILSFGLVPARVFRHVTDGLFYFQGLEKSDDLLDTPGGNIAAVFIQVHAAFLLCGNFLKTEEKFDAFPANSAFQLNGKYVSQNIGTSYHFQSNSGMLLSRKFFCRIFIENMSQLNL